MDAVKPNCEKKVWGKTRCIHLSNETLIFHASIERGGYCSRHYHKTRVNDFYVVRGVLTVVIYTDEPTGSETRLTLLAGDKLTIPPNVWHRFEANTGDVELIETYWLMGIDPSDIVRHDEGGKLELPSAS